MNSRVHNGEIINNRFDNWQLYEGVRTRRVMAFFIDYVTIAVLVAIFAVIVAFVGIITLGLGWFLYAILVPLVALAYVAFTLGGPDQATIGMRMTNIRLERLDGVRVDGIFAILHTVLFWAANTILTPFILLATLVLDRKRAVHDMLLGTVVVRADHPLSRDR